MKNEEIYANVTARIIEALETGAANPTGWKRPWDSAAAGSGLPSNAITTRKAYRGINVPILWSEQLLRGYTSPLWATYKQWATVGAQVRKGEKAATVILWKPTQRKFKNEAGDDETKASLYARTFSVFNASQVDGFEIPTQPERPVFEVVEAAQRFFATIGADVRHGGNRAYYSPGLDAIQLPEPEYFTDNVSYYAVSAHEHVHWTSHEKRCDRQLGERFGSAQYAAEELVAEIGAAYVCGILGLANEPRADHFDYVANWIQLLKDDPKAIITASSKAQKAVDWLVEHAGVEQAPQESDVELEVAVA